MRGRLAKEASGDARAYPQLCEPKNMFRVFELVRLCGPQQQIYNTYIYIYMYNFYIIYKKRGNMEIEIKASNYLYSIY